jgi:hypothetical protein
MAFRTIDFSTNITDADGSDGTIVVDGLKFTVTGAAAGYTFNLNGGRLNFSEATSNQQFVMTVTETSGSTFVLHDYTINYFGTPATGTNAQGTWAASAFVIAGGQSTSIPASTGTFHYAAAFPGLDYPTAASMTIYDDHLGFDPALPNPTSTFSLDDLVIQDTVPANTPPVVTAGAVAAYTEGGAAAALDPGLTVTDADSATLVGATVSITGGFLAGDALNFTNTANIIGGFDAVSGTLTLAGADTLAHYRAALASITFSSTSDDPTNSGADTSRTINWDVDDGIATSSAVTSTVTVTAVNDAPVVTAGAVAAYTEGGAAVALDPGLIVTDADSANLSGAAVSITGGFLPGDMLNFVTQHGIIGLYDAAHGVLGLSGTASVADYQAALASITFSSTSHNPTNFNLSTSRTISWTATDGTAPSTTVTSTVNLTAVNDTPVVTAGAVAAYTEGGAAAVLDPGLTVTDADDINLLGATVSITGGFLAGDTLNFTNTANITGFYDTIHGTLTLLGLDSVAHYQAALASITFSSTSHNPTDFGANTDRTISWVANDGTPPGSAVISTVSITAVNEAPVVANAIPDQGVAEDTAWSFQFAANAFTDVDSSLGYTATLGDGSALPSWLSFNAATRTFSGTPPLNFNGPIDLKVTASDGTAAVSDTFTLAVTPVNDAPVVSIQGTPDVVIASDLLDFTPGSRGIAVGVGLNDGAGGLATAAGSPLSVSSTAGFFLFNVGVALGDLNRDGRLDMAVSDAANNAVHVLLGDGHGGFSAGPVVAAGSAPMTVALGDLDHDGRLDIVTGNIGDDTLSVMLADGLGGFSAPASIVAGSQPVSVALGDVNRDGYLDILAANANGGGGPGSVTVALNDGHGGFSTTTTVPVVQDPVKIALGDLNRDGILDLVVASGLTAGSVDVLLGDGLGGFTRVPGAPFATGSATYSVALGDINGDGVLDIAAGNNIDGNVSLFLGDGAGGFTAQAPLALGGAAPNSVALEDVNGDGSLDLVTLNAGQTVGVALNDGHGGFGAFTAAPIDAGVRAAANIFALGNLDNAQTVVEDTGLVFNAAHHNAITLSDPDANGGAETLTLTVLHGALTLAVANNLSIVSNAGGSTIRVTGTLADINAALDGLIYRPDQDYNGTDVLALDLNDNGNSGGAALTATALVPIDVTAVNDAPVLHDVPAGVAYSAGAVLVLAPGLTLTDVDSTTLASATVHVGAGAFTAHGDVLAVSAGGLAGTSIVANYNAATEMLTLSGTDTLAHYQQALEHVTFQTTNLAADRAQSIAWQLDDGSAAHNLSDLATTAISMPRSQVNDFNGSGHSAILWQNTDGTPAIWSMNGTSLVSGANAGFNPGPSWHTIGAGDFNGDGKADILWQNADGTPAIWLMDGTSILSGQNVGFNPGAAWHVIGAGDFDGDGKSDILWQNNNGQAAVWLMDGQTLKSGSDVGPNPGASWHVISSGDFNGDGKADILWQNQNGQAAVWLMDGRNLLSGANVGFNPGSDWHVQAAGDFNGDGKADILWQNQNGQAAVWMMDGQNLISGNNVGFNPGTSWQVHGTGDFNGDGKADIQWQNTDGTPAVWLMDGYNLVAGSNVGFDPGTNWHVVPPHHDALV